METVEINGFIVHENNLELLQKYLRNKHSIEAFVEPYKDHASDVNDSCTYKARVLGMQINKEFNNYSEALRHSIIKALENFNVQSDVS